jgi:uncharacterized protein with GYD domain
LEPQNRIEKVTPTIEALGGRVQAAYFAFGDHDTVVICEMPDNVSAAAFAIAVGSTGSASSYKSTPLITPDEAVEAMKKAAETGLYAALQLVSRSAHPRSRISSRPRLSPLQGA